MMARPWLLLIVVVFLIVLFPILFGQLMLASLTKLHLSPNAALALMAAIFFGGLVNIPIKRIARDRPVEAHALDVFGLSGFWPELRRTRQETIIAVNVGGCIVPAGIAVYQLAHLAPLGATTLIAVAVACAINIFVCYRFAQLLPGIGIALPGLVPPIVAAVAAMLLVPEHAAPAAFVAGVAGPLVGADLFHLKEIEDSAVGVASIGGAGTFDGIVLSGIVAAYLA